MAHQAGAAQAELVIENGTAERGHMAPDAGSSVHYRVHPKRAEAAAEVSEGTKTDLSSSCFDVQETIPKLTHVWLIDDNGGEIHEALSIYELRVSCFSSKMSTPEKVAILMARLNHQKPTLVWITIHGSPTTGVEPKSYRKRLSLVVSVCNNQLAAGRHLVLYA